MIVISRSLSDDWKGPSDLLKLRRSGLSLERERDDIPFDRFPHTHVLCRWEHRPGEGPPPEVLAQVAEHLGTDIVEAAQRYYAGWVPTYPRE